MLWNNRDFNEVVNSVITLDVVGLVARLTEFSESVEVEKLIRNEGLAHELRLSAHVRIFLL